MIDNSHIAMRLGLGLLVLSAGRVGLSQPYLPPTAAPAPAGAEVHGLAHEMTGLVLNLAEVMLNDLGGTAQGVYMIEDTRELGLSVRELRDAARRGADPNELARAFAGIDQSWNHLKSMLVQHGTSPAVNQAARRVEALEQQLRQAVGLQPPPMNLYDGVGAGLPDDLNQAQQEVRGLRQQAEALVASMRAELGNHPNREHVLQDARQLVERCNTFEQFLGQNPSHAHARTAYASISDVANCLHNDLSQAPPPPGVLQNWQSFSETQLTVHQSLGMPFPPPLTELNPVGPAQAPAPAPLIDQTRASVQTMRQHAEALVASMRAELGNHPNREHVLQDATHLVQRCDTFEQFLGQNPSPEHLQMAYASINDVANCLHNDFSQAPPPPTVLQSWQSFSETQVTVHQSLGLPTPPPPTALAPPVSPEITEARRVSVAMRQRAEALVTSLRTELGNHPNHQHILQDARQIVERTQSFEQVLLQNPTPERIERAYAPIQEVVNCLHGDLTREPPPQQVLQSWQSFVQTQYLIHQSLGVPAPPGQAHVTLRPPAPGAPPPVLGLADQLVGEVEGFLHGFAPTVHVVPEGRQFLADAERLHASAVAFRQAGAQGVDPGHLAHQFQEVEVHWNRLARRTERISRGRTGPNIQRIMGVGEICQQIHHMLGMSGQDPHVFPSY